MRSTLLTFLLVFLLPAALPAQKKEPRKPNPFAPSLPQLTDEEEEEIDRIVDRFILYDTGRLRGPEGKKALAEFNKLGPEAIFGLIRGLNKAAGIEASCPALTIGKKVLGILRSTRDVQLLEFARENIGAGVGKTRHGGVLNDLRVACMFRKRAVGQGAVVAAPAKKAPRSMSVAELTAAIPKERGLRRRQLLAELAGRQGDEVIDALRSAAATPDAEVGPLGRTLLARHLAALDADALKEKLKDDREEVRAAAARAVGMKGLRFGDELIGLLTDANPDVCKAAHQSLVRLSRGIDYGPKQDASEGERAEAVKKWKAWWGRQKKR